MARVCVRETLPKIESLDFFQISSYCQTDPGRSQMLLHFRKSKFVLSANGHGGLCFVDGCKRRLVIVLAPLVVPGYISRPCHMSINS